MSHSSHLPACGPSGTSVAQSIDRKWVRLWSDDNWSCWMAQCRVQRKSASGQPKRATKKQRAFLRHRKLPARVLEFVTSYEAHYLIDRLEREDIAFQNWRSQKRASGEWRGQ